MTLYSHIQEMHPLPNPVISVKISLLNALKISTKEERVMTMTKPSEFPGLRKFTPTKLNLKFPVPSDIEIAQAAELKPIS